MQSTHAPISPSELSKQEWLARLTLKIMADSEFEYELVRRTGNVQSIRTQALNGQISYVRRLCDLAYGFFKTERVSLTVRHHLRRDARALHGVHDFPCLDTASARIRCYCTTG